MGGRRGRWLSATAGLQEKAYLPPAQMEVPGTLWDTPSIPSPWTPCLTLPPTHPQPRQMLIREGRVLPASLPGSTRHLLSRRPVLPYRQTDSFRQAETRAILVSFRPGPFPQAAAGTAPSASEARLNEWSQPGQEATERPPLSFRDEMTVSWGSNQRA